MINFWWLRTSDPIAFTSFLLPLDDLGNGAVNTALTIGTGPATFTRATQAATKLSTGLWKLDVASGTARSSYIGLNTAVGAYGGYLAEGAATQLCLDPRDMTTANWVLGATMTRAKTSTGIDGTANSATRLTGGAVTGTNTILQTLVAASTSRTYSAWVRRVTGTGTITLLQGTATLDITALINSTTYTLVQLNDNELNVAFGFQISTNADAIDVDCNQFEAGAMATTPIPAAGARNSDALTYLSTGNVSGAIGSIYADVSVNSIGNSSGIAISSSGGNTPQLLRIQSSTVFNASDGTNSPTLNTGPFSSSTVYRCAQSWGAGLSGTVNGAAVGAGSFDGDLNFVTNIRVGDLNGASQLFGTIKNVRILMRQLSDTQLQAQTS